MATGTINMTGYKAKYLSNSYGSATLPVYFDAGVPKTITSYQGNAATATALTSNAGGGEQPIYFTGGKPAATSYALKATVNNGTAGRLVYYSDARAISSTTNIHALNNYLISNSRNGASVDIRANGLIIWGQTYGNTANQMLSNTAGVFRFGDGGPQIVFNTSNSWNAQAGALVFTDNDTAGTGTSFHFVTTESSDDTGGNCTVTAPRFRARKGLTIGQNSDNTSHALYVNGSACINGNTLKITNNSNTVTIGSQNASFCHIYNSANIMFIFNNRVSTTAGGLGSSDYPWSDLWLKGPINYKGTAGNYTPISFFDSGDQYGLGILIGAGGCTMIGAGESAGTVKSNVSPAGGTETLYICSDNNIEFYPAQNSYDAAAHHTVSASGFWAGIDGNTTREIDVGVRSGAGTMYMYSVASATGDRGIWVPAHGSGGAKNVFKVDTNNAVTFYGALSGNAATATTASYANVLNNDGGRRASSEYMHADGKLRFYLASSSMTTGKPPTGDGFILKGGWDNAGGWDAMISWSNGGHMSVRGSSGGGNATNHTQTWAAWNTILDSGNYTGYTVTKTGSGASGTWGISISGNANTATYQNCVATNEIRYARNGNMASANDLWQGWAFAEGKVAVINGWRFGNGNGGLAPIYGSKVYNAVWNDFAEYRESDETEGGRVLVSNGSGKLVRATERLQPAARVISDTFGCSVGMSDIAKTPIGVAGRVLVHPYQNRNNYKVGDAVCAAPDGTADIMTREEIIQYPDRIIGIVDEIPEYKIWQSAYTNTKNCDGTGEVGETNTTDIPVNGRIWIYVR